MLPQWSISDNSNPFFKVFNKNTHNKADRVYYDVTADKYQRPHHQILIRNLTEPIGDSRPEWWVIDACV